MLNLVGRSTTRGREALNREERFVSVQRSADSGHRIAQVNYPPRVLGLGLTVIAVVLLYHERELALWVLPVGVLILLIYPHLAYFYATRASDSKQAEKNNLLVDCLLLGLWSAVLGFHAWLTFCMASSSLLNNAVNGGGRRLALAAIIFALGSAVWVAGAILLTGYYQLRPDSSWLVNAYVIAATLVYFFGVGITFHRQNAQLARAHKEIAEKNRIFRSLLDMGIVTYRAADLSDLSDLSDLMEGSLQHFRSSFPTQASGLSFASRVVPMPSVMRSLLDLRQSSRTLS